MKKLVFGTFAALIIIGTQAFAGGGSTGGGESVVLPSGEVKFLDLIPNEELPSQVMSHDEVLKKFYATHRYVKQFAFHDDSFFDCAIQRLQLQKDNYKAFSRLITVLASSKQVIQTEFELGKVPADYELGSLSLPYAATESSRIDGSLQEPVAAFSSGIVWVSGRIYRAMNTSDQCAASVHESLRQLNFSGIIVAPLTTTEIETTTRWIMGDSFATDDLTSAVTKLQNLNMTALEYADKARQKDDEAMALSNALFEHKFSKEEEAAYHTQVAALDDQAHEYTAKSIELELSSISSAVIGLTPQGRATEQGSTQKLPALKYADLLKMKIVTRIR